MSKEDDEKVSSYVEFFLKVAKRTEEENPLITMIDYYKALAEICVDNFKMKGDKSWTK